MPAAPCFKFTVVAITKQRVVVGVRLDENVPAIPAISTRWSAARDILLPAKRDASVAAISRFYRYFCFVRKHVFTRESNLENTCKTSTMTISGEIIRHGRG